MGFVPVPSVNWHCLCLGCWTTATFRKRKQGHALWSRGQRFGRLLPAKLLQNRPSRLPVPRREQRRDIPHAERCAVGVQPWVYGNIPSRCTGTLPLLPAFLGPGLPVPAAEGLLRSPEI